MTLRVLCLALIGVASGVTSGCGFLQAELPEEPVPLVDMEEPRRYFPEPDDEAERVSLTLGTFTGIRAGDSRGSLEAMLEAPDSVRVVSLVENSPAVAAGVELDDLIFEGALDDTPFRPIRRPSELSALELEGRPGGTLRLRLDRAGREMQCVLTLEPRLRPADREPVQRYREEQHLGAVFRSATEVEARKASLPSGAGAVLVGLTRRSPLRVAGLEYGDLITHFDGELVAHPQDILVRVNDREGEELGLRFTRGEEAIVREITVSEREGQMKKIHLPLLYRYDRERDRRRTSILLGLFSWETTPVAWEFSFLWFFEFSGGDSDRLEEVE